MVRLLSECLEAALIAALEDGIGDGERTGKSALSHQPTGREGDRRSMGIAWEKDAPARARQFTGRERQNSARMGGDPFPSCVADIVDNMPTRKGAKPTLFLVCIDGVRV